MTPNKIQFLDLETGTREWYGAKASPRHPENYVVMHGQAIDEKPYDGVVTGARYEKRGENWLHIPDDVWLLVVHNAPFEMDWALVQQRAEIMKFLKRGGRVFDTAYAHYLLSNQQDTYPALDYVAPIYGGTHKVDGIKLLWEQGVMTEDIDPALLSEYLLGPEGDIENTRKVFYGEVAQLQERGMWDMALERMEGLIANCFAMDAGMHVDRTTAFKDLAEMEEELGLLTAAFKSHRANFPDDVVFKETSKHHMSAWLFGGPIKYRARVPALDAAGAVQFEKDDVYKFGETLVHSQIKLEDGTERELTGDEFAACVQTYGPCDRYTRGKNAGSPKLQKVESTRIKMKWGEVLFQAPGLIPLKDLPKDVRDAFLKDYSGKLKLADESPVISTGSEPIEMLSKRVEFNDETKGILRSLLKFAKIDKDVGTYYLRNELDDDGNIVKQSGMLQYLTPEDIVYHVLNVTSTVTTRLSSNRPNMQNLPRGDSNEFHKSRVKHMFTSRFGADGVIIEADYQALEVVTLACFSQDKALIQALLDGTDMHCMRLAAKLGEPYEEVLKKCKDETHPDHKRYKQMRTDIKPPSFAYQYGASAMGIAFATGMPIDEAENFIANEKRLFPGVESFYNDGVIPSVEENVTRRREQMEDGTWRMYGVGTWKSPAGTTYEFRQYPKTRWVNGAKMEFMEFKPTQIRNYPIQGESGFFVQGIAGMVMRWLVANDFFGGKCLLINQVHDALYFDVHKDVLHIVAPVIQQIMEYLPTYFSQKYGYTLTVPFPAAVEYGPNMAEKQHYQPEQSE